MQRTTRNPSEISYEPAHIQRYCRGIDLPAKAFDSGLPSLAKLRKDFGDDQAEGLVKLWIIDIVEYFNIGKNMTPEQIEQTAPLILDEFYYLNLADINLVFKRAKTGFYGELFDRLDGQIILKWFKEYNKERCLAAEELNINESSGYSDLNARQGERALKRISDIQSNLKR